MRSFDCNFTAMILVKLCYIFLKCEINLTLPYSHLFLLCSEHHYCYMRPCSITVHLKSQSSFICALLSLWFYLHALHVSFFILFLCLSGWKALWVQLFVLCKCAVHTHLTWLRLGMLFHAGSLAVDFLEYWSISPVLYFIFAETLLEWFDWNGPFPPCSTFSYSHLPSYYASSHHSSPLPPLHPLPQCGAQSTINTGTCN